MSEKPSLLYLLGSPRNGGNTDVLGGEICRGFEEAGGTSERVNVAELSIRGCTGCRACMDDRPDICVLDDDMTELYEKILSATALLLATPIYYSSPTAQMKLMIDRFFPFGDFQKTRHCKELAGLPVGLAIVYAEADPLESGVFQTHHILKAASTGSGGTLVGWVHGTADEKGDMIKRPDLLAEGRALGVKLYDKAKGWRG
jgi:multimeric flavodoxin WrbA